MLSGEVSRCAGESSTCGRLVSIVETQDFVSNRIDLFIGHFLKRKCDLPGGAVERGDK